MRKIKVNEDMKHSFKRVPNDACIGGIGCVVSEFAGVALKGVCVLRTLVFVAAIVMPSYSVKAEVEYVDAAFSLTYNSGPKSGTTEYFANLAEAVAAAAEGDDIVQLADFTTADMVTIDKGLGLNLNGYTYTSTNETAAITVDNGTLVMNCYNKVNLDINGTLQNNSTTGGKSIKVVNGGILNVLYANIASASDYAVYVEGEGNIENCKITGKNGIYLDGDNAVEGTEIIAEEYGIYGLGDCVIIRGNVSISGCSQAGMYLDADENVFVAQPTFGTGDNANGTDIWLANGRKMIIYKTFNYTPGPKITVRVTDSEGKDIDADDLPLTITTGYAAKFTSNNTLIDPAAVFAYANTSTGFVVALKDNAEAAIFAGKTFAFAEGQTWMTWCDANDYQKPSGITAYRITGVSANAVTVEAVDDGTLPAYTPLLLMKKESGSLTAINLGAGNAPQTGYDDQTGIVTAGGTTDTGWAFYGNAGNNGIAAAAAIYTAEGGFLHVGRDATGTASYVLRDGQFILVDQNQGLAAHRCLLNVSAGNSNARTLSIGKVEDVTGITTTDFTDYTDSDDVWYDLQGRRVSTPARGIYIQEGRKIVVK